jgi:RimJ/RimL family protein N-acetyltransferase
MTTFGFGDLKAGRCLLPLMREGIREGDLRAADAEDAPALSVWRHTNRRWFLTEFPCDTQATQAWIEAIRNAPDRLLLVVHAEGEPVGVLGLRGIDLGRREAEVDNVLRGRATPSRRGLMSLAVGTLAVWAAHELSVRRLYLYVFRDNPACSFYRRLGFVVIGDSIGLCFEGTSGHGGWKPTTQEPERYLLRMELAIDAATLELAQTKDSS